LVLVIGVSMGLSYFSLTDGDWWGDFAGYFVQAKAILAGDPQTAVDGLSAINARSTHPPGPDAYPWGYPLLVAGVAGRFGFSPVAIKIINVLFYGLFLLILFFFARRKVPAVIAPAITAAFAFSPISLSLVDHMRSDVVYMALSLGAILCFDAVKERPSRLGWLGLGLLVFLSYSLRTVGALLLVMPITMLIFSPAGERARRLGWAGWMLGAFALLTLLYRMLLPGGESSYLSHLDPITLAGFWKSILLNFVIPKMLFSPLPVPWIWYVLLLAAFILGVWRVWRQELGVLLYLGAMIAVLVLWPEPQGYRFFAPILPIGVVYAAAGALSIKPDANKFFGITASEWGVLVFFVIFLLFTVPITLSTARTTIAKQRVISGPFDRHSAALYKAIRKLVPENAWIEFTKPRSVLFFTDRLAYDVGRCEDLDAEGYALFNDRLDELVRFTAVKFLECPGISRRLIYENPKYQLYEYHAE